MRVVPEGRPFIALALLVLVLLALLAWRVGGPWRIGALVWFPVALWVPAFFREPLRQGPRDPRLILAPADGRVVSVAAVDEPDYLRGRATRVSVFMNVFNVHVNYHPMDGVVEYRQYRPGTFVNATLDKASVHNEQMSLGVRGGERRLMVRQIAGLIARRIVTDHELGDTVGQGSRLGLIRFGSRVDTFLPDHAEPRVRVGDRTVGGVTVIGAWVR
ncbi:MAG: phosphatidylserine decarboxylase [Gemmatimonadetes bacterium RIFCSPLOWO2_12_FULL_68_9]|nr:MAG: phosphatidylserine decarboxylase [Gemmatimonadetes bacterium RIFCSPLOWO2_12_FULL_68_9]